MISGAVGHPITVETIINGTIIYSYFLENMTHISIIGKSHEIPAVALESQGGSGCRSSSGRELSDEASQTRISLTPMAAGTSRSTPAPAADRGVV